MSSVRYEAGPDGYYWFYEEKDGSRELIGYSPLPIAKTESLKRPKWWQFWRRYE